MRIAELITRAVAGFVDLLVVLALNWLPDIVGFLAACGYILFRDGLFYGRSLGKKLVGLRVERTDDTGRHAGFRESVIRNLPLAVAYLLFLIPYAGWVLGPAALFVEGLAALGDEQGMRIGDLLAGTVTAQEAPAEIEQKIEPAEASGAVAESGQSHPSDV